MGNTSPQTTYSVQISPPSSPLDSGIYRHPLFKSDLASTPDPSIKTLRCILEKNKEKFAARKCLGSRKNGIEIWRTYKEAIEMGKWLFASIRKRGLEPKKEEYHGRKLRFVALYSKNREEFIISDFSCIYYDLVSVPIYDTLGPEAVEYIFDHTMVELLIVSNENIRKLLKDKKLAHLKNIIKMDKEPLSSDEITSLSEKNINIHDFWEMMEEGKTLPAVQIPELGPENIYTFSYTSGTTGKPKGAMLTHANFVSAMSSATNLFHFGDNEFYLSYLPLAHVFERLVFNTMLFIGATIGFFCGDVQKLKEDLAWIRPTIFITVPRLLLRFHDVIKTNLGKLKGCKKKLADKAINTKLANLASKGSVNHGLYDKLIFKKMRAALGGRVEKMLIGSAPTSAEVLDFMKIAFNVAIVEGYGQTEATAASCSTWPDDGRGSGCVGGPCANTEIKIVSVPEMNYFSTDKDENGNICPRGELCLRGSGVFLGYYKDDEKTKEALDNDGWLHTGDVVKMNVNGSIKIIDRKKNIFKLSHGEYVAVEKVESVYLKSHLINEIFVYGDSFQNYLVAIVCPNPDAIMEICSKIGVKEENIDKILKMKKFQDAVIKELNIVGKEGKLLGFEMVKKIYFEKDSFVNKDILTTTFKIKRHEAKILYQKEIDELYKEGVPENK